MAVAIDAASEAHTSTTGSASEASFTWNHGGHASNVKGVLIYVWNNADANNVTSVTYGGTTVPAVSGGEAADTAGEPGRCTAYFLGENVPQGTQAVVVNRNNNATVMSANAITVTANQPTRVVPGSIVLTTGDAAVAEVAVTDAVGGMTGVNSMRFAGGHFGHQTPPTAGANSTLLQSLDIGATCFVTFRETTAGTGSRSVGGSNGTSDDRAIVSLAIAETYAPTPAPLTLTGLALTLAIAMNIAVPAGALTYTGLAPTLAIESGVTIAVPVGSTPLTGYASSLSEGLNPALSAGSVPFTGTAPVLSYGVDLPAGAVTITGIAPGVHEYGGGVNLPAGGLAYTGHALSLDVWEENPMIEIPAGQLNIKGPQSATGVDRWTQAGRVSFTGLALTLSIAAGAVDIAIPAGQLNFKGPQRPALAIPAGQLNYVGRTLTRGEIDIPVGVLSHVGLTPTIQGTTSDAIAVPAGSLNWSGLTPTVRTGDRLFELPAGQIVIKGPARPQSVHQMGAGSVPFTGRVLFVAVDAPGSNIGIPPGVLALTGTTSTVIQTQSIDIPAGTLTLTGQYVAVAFMQPDAGHLVWQGLAPSIGGTQAISISPTTGTLNYHGEAPTAHLTVAMPVGVLAWTFPAMEVTSTGTIAIPAGSLAFTGTASTVDLVCALPAGQLTLTGQLAVIDRGIDIPSGSLRFSSTALEMVAGDRIINFPEGGLDLAGRQLLVVRTIPVVQIVRGRGTRTKRVYGRASSQVTIRGKGSI